LFIQAQRIFESVTFFVTFDDARSQARLGVLSMTIGARGGWK